MKLTRAQKAKLAKLTPFQRAVGNALAKNPLAPTIPCHRVTRSDGKIGGYSGGGGTKGKKLLLLRERRNI